MVDSSKGESNLATTLTPKDQLDHFDPAAYLRQYYGDNDVTRGLKIVLLFLPNLAARIGRQKTLLDIGSGPAVYMALGFRQNVDEIYLSDYAEQNRRELQAWLNGSPVFDWTPICKAIANMEGKSNWRSMESEAASKVKGILYCDVHSEAVLDEQHEGRTFDIVSTVFCLEYASDDYDQYRRAVRNVCRLVRPGGTLIVGGALEESHYTIGPKKFACHYLTEDQLLEALSDAGIATESDDFVCLFHEGAFVVAGTKK